MNMINKTIHVSPSLSGVFHPATFAVPHGLARINDDLQRLSAEVGHSRIPVVIGDVLGIKVLVLVDQLQLDFGLMQDRVARERQSLIRSQDDIGAR